MKKIIVLIIFLLPITLYAYQNEPDGFRGIKWGTDIKTLKDMKLLDVDSKDRFYSKKGDKMKIGNAKLENIIYRFWDNEFYAVMVNTKGSSNWTAFKKAVFEKFGKGYQGNEYIKEYSWRGQITIINLKYNEFSEEGTLILFSVKIREKEEDYQKQKAKEGAKEDF